MIPVMIVDDEKLLRSLIIRSINWRDLDLEVVCEAADGEEALDAIEKHAPAIAIVDINMPFMNGLELTRIISERYPDMQVIILTGYSEFEYARDALRAKASNYITKPIDEAELTSALATAAETVLRLQESTRQMSRLQTELFRGQIASQDKFLRQLFYGHLQEKEIQLTAALAGWGCDFSTHDLLVAIISLDQAESPQLDGKDAVNLQYAVANLAQEIFCESHPCAVLLEADLTIAFLIGIDRRPGDKSGSFAGLDMDGIRNDCQRILKLSDKYVGVQPVIALGSIRERLQDVSRSFRDAVQVLRDRFYQPDPSQAVILEWQPVQRDTEGVAWPIADFITIMTSLRLGDGAACSDSVSRVFEQARESRLPEDVVRSMAMNLLSILFAHAAEREAMQIERNFDDMVSRIRLAGSLDELCRLMLTVYQDILAQLNVQSAAAGLHPMVRKALAEIEQHYDNPGLTLDLIARSIFVNPSYLSSLFHNDMGKTMIDYLIEYRMSQAYRLLVAEKGRDIADIAASVGYRDVYYFSRCFRKHFGVAPTHFRLPKP